MSSLARQIDWDKCGGLVPAIVQDSITGRVLMLGYMNDAALLKTETCRDVTFYSRTKGRLWTKGESSGNKLALVSIELDCDKDALLVQATPFGPTCHTLKSSCFDMTTEQAGFGFFGTLQAIIANSADKPANESYTAQLLQSGVRRIAQKVGEEGVEVALAASAGDAEELVDETADLMYHLLVLLHERNLALSDVANALAQRNAG